MQKNLYIPIDIQIKNIVECTQLVKRGDTLTLIIKVFNNAVLADLTSQSVDLILKKSDGKLIEKTITSVSNGVITATLDVQATNVAGIVQGEVQIYTSDTLSSTNTFTFNVDSSLTDDVLEASQDDIEVLADLKNTITAGNAAIDKYKENVEAITNSADAVEALADIKLYIDTNLADLQQANAQATINIGNETSQNTQAVQNISDLTAINNTSSTLKSELDSDISNGNTLKSGLESDITTGNTLKDNLETDFATGNQLKSDLESTISTGDTLKINLDTANTQAEANIEALNALGDVTEIAQDVTNLKNEVETARGTYNNLGARLDADKSNITSNSNKIGDLSANGLTEANLATAIKNDRTQLSDVAHKTGTIQTNLNSDKLDGYDAGNASGNIPVSNGTINANLNADMLDGQHGSYYAPLASPNFSGTPQISSKTIATTETTALTLLNGWTAQIGNVIISRTGNQVTINAVLSGGTTSSGTIFANIPSGLRPSSQRYFECYVANSSWVLSLVGILINGDGNMNFDGAASGNTRLVCNISYTI